MEASRALPSRGDLSDEELVAILVEHGVPERVALERIANMRKTLPTVVGRKGHPIPIEETELEVWLSLGSFG